MTVFLSRCPVLISMFLLVGCCLFAPSCPSWAQNTGSGAATAGAITGDPIPGPIRKGDVVRIIVAEAEQLGGDFRIDTDGSVVVPRIGPLQLEGLMPVDAARTVAKEIMNRRLLRSPSVGVYIIGRKAREVSINGAVTIQGRQVIRENTLLSEVLESANPASTADLSRVVITRNGKELTINYRKFRNGESNRAEFNPELEENDRIYIFTAIPPEGTIRVTGEVKDSTKVVIPILQGTTVGQVLQTVGGLTEFADRRNITILRTGQRIPVRYDDILRAVPQSDILLQDKDEILIPRLEKRKQFAVAGAVRLTQTFPLVPGTTLLEALGEAGGPQDGAQQNKVEVRRKTESGRVVTRIYDVRRDKDAGTLIEDGDYIFVPFGRRRPSLDIGTALGIASTLGVLLSQFRR